MNLAPHELRDLSHLLVAFANSEETIHLLGSDDQVFNHQALIRKNAAQELYKKVPVRILEAAMKIINPNRLDRVCK